MALATPTELRTLLDLDTAALPDATASLLLELATGEVQAAAGQQLVEVVDDQITIMGTPGWWMDLPERPVTAVSTVTLDGESIADYKRFGARLWRAKGWASAAYEPGEVTVTYTHGYATGDDRLALARKLTLSLAGVLHSDPEGTTGGYSIDDYREQTVQTGGGDRPNLLPETSRRLLRRTYGRRAGLARVG